jgi:TetR/AcrR family transcriptional regulator, transcriptional repressor for nem operon
MFSQWVGALILARAAGTGELSQEILDISKKVTLRDGDGHLPEER